MYCPKCGAENPDGAQLCQSCSWVLTSISKTAISPDAKTSGLAITALVLAILSFFTLFLTAIPALIFGIVSLVKIEKSAGQLKGKGLAIAGIVTPVASIPIVMLLAGIITFTTRRSGVDMIEPGMMIWVKCSNKACGAEYQMDKKDYFEYLKEHQDPMSMAAPAIVCKDCGEERVYRAVKCEKCKLVFERGSVQHDFADRCPECGHSKTEELRKQARQRR